MFAPVTMWYDCVTERVQVATDLRFQPYEFSLANSILKVPYDASWAFLGGTVDSFKYRNTLAAMGSFVTVVEEPPGVFTEFITTPLPYLANQLPKWKQATTQNTPCPLKIGGYGAP